MKNDKILSIQSRLAYGYVGNNVAELAIQLHGLDVISLPTVLLATHTGHKPIYGRATDKASFDELIKGIEAIHVLDTTACVVTGYIGTDDILGSTLDFVRRIKKQYPDKLYICDPVMGDFDQGMYVPETVAGKIQSELIPLCDVLTPNQFELEHMLGKKIRSIEEVTALVAHSPAFSDKTFIITGCLLEDTPEGIIESLVVRNGKIDRIHSRRIAVTVTGAGDLYTAILASQLARGKDMLAAVQKAADTLSSCFEDLASKGLTEMNAACILKYLKP
ncbi:pyridoxal kinase [Dysgonomonas sp. 25]|uniref:pyridoxal kinase n=1 Tax=Dysgonomonas sp. 25 TaxID=2302933 RepID=UPI0013D18301|nr:pyridoxal kinase [Dysgonomonas sp. 25]NDV69773.1 pyridoxal kinase [Dysgonomonas sp. 25]